MLLYFIVISGTNVFGDSTQTIGGPKGVVQQQLRTSVLGEGAVVDLRQTTFQANWGGPYGQDKPLQVEPILPDQKEKLRIVPNKSLYPLILESKTTADITVTGGTFVGVQHRGLTWRVMKMLYDGCGALTRSGGLMTLEDMRFDNVMDAIRPHGTGRFLIRNVYARYIRDDFVENDELLPGEIRDSLVDGTFVFLSQRPAKRSADARRKDRDTDVTTITNTLVRIMAMPFDHGATVRNKRISKEGLAPGMLFKWSPTAGDVYVENCIFLMDSMGANGPNSMKLPPGTYRNVTLIWGGEGDYPAPLPEGVTITKDRAVWERARKAWFAERNLQVLPEPQTGK